ncbi:hypothetical protein JCM10213_006383 [Rhodosporidiobolus nylandii]
MLARLTTRLAGRPTVRLSSRAFSSSPLSPAWLTIRDPARPPEERDQTIYVDDKQADIVRDAAEGKPLSAPLLDLLISDGSVRRGARLEGIQLSELESMTAKMEGGKPVLELVYRPSPAAAQTSDDPLMQAFNDLKEKVAVANGFDAATEEARRRASRSSALEDFLWQLYQRADERCVLREELDELQKRVSDFRVADPSKMFKNLRLDLEDAQRHDEDEAEDMADILRARKVSNMLRSSGEHQHQHHG